MKEISTVFVGFSFSMKRYVCVPKFLQSKFTMIMELKILFTARQLVHASNGHLLFSFN